MPADRQVCKLFAQQIEPNAAHEWHLNKPSWGAETPFLHPQTGPKPGYIAKTTVNI